MTAGERMTRYVVRISYDESAFRAAELMRKNRVGALPVVQGGKVVGIVTDRDIVTRCIAGGRSPLDTIVDRIMSRPAVCVESSSPLPDALALMAENRVKRLPVLKEGKLVGMLCLSDAAVSSSETLLSETYRSVFSGHSDEGSFFFHTFFS